jgi:uncharacterized phage protein (TIGR02218 family)
MKPATPQMLALLKTRRFFKSDLYTITLKDGVTVFRYCSGDKDIIYNGHTYSAGGLVGPFFNFAGSGNGCLCHFSIGLNVDTMQITILPRNAQLLGLPFTTAVRYGLLDGATFQRDVAIMATYGDTSAGVILMFFGTMGEVDVVDQAVTMSINAPTELLNLQSPKNLITPGCMNTLYDASCTVNPAAFRGAVVVTGGSRGIVLANGVNQRSDYYALGKIVFTSGANNGLARSIRQYVNPGTFYIFPPLPQASAIGDTANVFPGCNLSATDINGCPKFANQANFRGFPNVPVAETVV